jgi:hypothetical protein
MKKSNLIAICLATVCLSGCSTMSNKLSGLSIKKSTYTPTNVTKGELNDYFDMLEKVEGRVVSDELGRYFHKKEREGEFSRFALLNEDGDFLKLSLSNSAGLMEPIYSHDSRTKLQLDWDETKRAYRFLTQTIGLKLLPLKYTKKYHEGITGWASKRATELTQAHSLAGQKMTMINIIASSVKTTSDVMSGEMGLYNPDYYNAFLSKLPDNVSYIVHFNNVSEYSGSSALGSKPDERESASYYSQLASRLSGFSWAAYNFVPVSYFKTLKSGGGFRYYSGCQVMSKKENLEMIDHINEVGAVPYYSGIKHSITDKDPEKIVLAKKRFKAALKQVSKNRRLVENACKVGYKGMGLSGAIESKKLR